VFKTTEYIEFSLFTLAFVEEKIFVSIMKVDKVCVVEKKLLRVNGDMVFINLN